MRLRIACTGFNTARAFALSPAPHTSCKESYQKQRAGRAVQWEPRLSPTRSCPSVCSFHEGGCRLRAEPSRQQQLDPPIGQVLPQAGLCKQDMRGPDTPLRFVQLSPRGWTCLCLGRVAVISRRRVRQITREESVYWVCKGNTLATQRAGEPAPLPLPVLPDLLNTDSCCTLSGNFKVPINAQTTSQVAGVSPTQPVLASGWAQKPSTKVTAAAPSLSLPGTRLRAQGSGSSQKPPPELRWLRRRGCAEAPAEHTSSHARCLQLGLAPEFELIQQGVGQKQSDRLIWQRVLGLTSP